MWKKSFAKFISLIMSFIMVFALVPNNNNKVYCANGDAVVIEGEGGPITITKTGGPPPADCTGIIFTIPEYTAVIERDYAQSVGISVKNTMSETVRFYLQSAEYPDDLSMGFIGNGSRDIPMILEPNEETEVTFQVFAQNAINSVGYALLQAFVYEGGSFNKIDEAILNLTVNGVGNLEVSVTQQGADNALSLERTYRLENNDPNKTTIKDATVYLDGEIANYASLNPIISNYELLPGRTIDFNVKPDLFNMWSNGKGTLSGNIVVTGLGGTQRIPISIGTDLNKIQVTEASRVGLINDGNEFWDLEYRYDPEGPKFNKDDFEILEENRTESGFSVKIKFKMYYAGGSQVLDGWFNLTGEYKDSAWLNSGAAQSYKDFDVNISEPETGVGVKYEVLALLDISSSDIQQLSFSSGEFVSLMAESALLADSGTATTAISMSYGVADAAAQASNWTKAAGTASKLGNAFSVIGIGMNLRDMWCVVNNPNFSPEEKNKYLALTAADVLLTGVGMATGPVGSVVSGIGSLVISKVKNDAVGGKQPCDPDSNSDRTDISGSQCTNRRQTSNDFKAPPSLNKDGSPGSGKPGDPPPGSGSRPGGNYPGDSGSGSGSDGPGSGGDGPGGDGPGGSSGTTFGWPIFDEEEPEMWFLGRMAGNGYINNDEIGYDYYLNGQHIGGGRNVGLTSLNIADLTPGMKNLKLGEANKLEVKYDTYPGSHAVTTDNSIIFVFSPATPVAFVSSSALSLTFASRNISTSPSALDLAFDVPDSIVTTSALVMTSAAPNALARDAARDKLPDMRSLPDFAVYMENINFKNTPIIGEQNAIVVTYYNRDAGSGYCDINVTIDGTAINLGANYKNRLVYRFTSQTVEIPYTPTKTSHEIKVELTNRCGTFDNNVFTETLTERNYQNNSTVRTLTARTRQVPVISKVSPKGNTSNARYLSAVVDYALDVSEVKFYLDGSLVSGEVFSSPSGDKSKDQNTYSILAPQLTLGSHVVKAEVIYKTNPTATSSITMSETFNFAAKISLPGKFVVYDSVNYIYVDAPASVDIAIVENDPIDLNSYSTGVYVLIEGDSFTSSFFDTATKDRLTMDVVSKTGTLNIEAKNEYYGYPTTGSGTATLRITLDKGTANAKSIDFVVTVKSYEQIEGFAFKMPSAVTDLSSFKLMYSFGFSANEMEYSQDDLPFVVLDAKQNIYKLIFSKAYLFKMYPPGGMVNYTIAAFNGDTLYMIPVTSNSPGSVYAVSDSGYASLKINKGAEVTINNISVGPDAFDNYPVLLPAASLNRLSEIKLPKDGYVIMADYTSNGQRGINMETLDLSAVNGEINIGAGAGSIEASISWDTVLFNPVTDLALAADGVTFKIPGYRSGSKIFLPNNDYDYSVALMSSAEDTYTISGNIGPSNKSIIIESTFKTDVQIEDSKDPVNPNSFNGYEQATIRLQNIKDNNGNSLSSFSANYSSDTVLYGVLTLESTTDPAIKYRVLLEESTYLFSYSSYTVTLPNVNGTFTVKVILSTSKSVLPQPDVIITATSGPGGTVSGGGEYFSGNEVTLVARPDSGFTFDGWYENDTKIQSAGATYRFTAAVSRTLQARFKAIASGNYTIGVSAGQGGTVTGGGSYAPNSQVTLTATPNVGYKFDGWYENNAKVSSSASYQFNATGDRVLEARFIWVGEGGGGSGSGGGGGGSSRGGGAVTVKDSKPTAPGDIIVISGGSSSLSPSAIKELIDAGKPAIFSSNGYLITFDTALLKTLLELYPNKSLVISVSILSDSDTAKLINGKGIKLEAKVIDIKITMGGKEVKEFIPPLLIEADIADSEISESLVDKLSGVRLNDDGTINKLGGTYDNKTKKHSFNTSKQSKYSVMLADDLVSLLMKLDSKSYTLNKVQKSFDVTPVIVEGRTLVPIRLISESFGADVDWDDLTKTVTIKLGDKTLNIKIGEKLPGMDVPAQIISGRTMVPLRFISEYFDANVVYNDSDRTIAIYR